MSETPVDLALWNVVLVTSWLYWGRDRAITPLDFSLALRLLPGTICNGLLHNFIVRPLCPHFLRAAGSADIFAPESMMSWECLRNGFYVLDNVVGDEVSISVGTLATGKSSLHFHLRVWVFRRGGFYLGLCSLGKLSDLQRPSIHIPRSPKAQASSPEEDLTLAITMTTNWETLENSQ